MRSRFRSAVMVAACAAVLSGTACTFSLFQLPGFPAGPTLPAAPPVPSPTPLPKAQTVFVVTLPEPLPPGSSLALSLLDEVTGLALNQQLFPMQARDAVTYAATLALPYGAVIRYRYVRLGSTPILEDSALDEPIRYRLYYVSGQNEVQDQIASWSDKPSTSPVGNIEGRVLNADTGAPIPNILVTAAGQRTFSDSAGRFSLPGLLSGTHNLVAYAPDGMYTTFQQGATVAPNLSTPVEVHLQAMPLVRVTFNVSVPKEGVQGAPVRMAGNLFELGNTFADLRGGVSTIADRMPILSLQPDGRYSITLSLPAGAYVQYKYTLGDGFWNAEHKPSGEFELREMLVPQQDAIIEDRVATWRAGASAPILFEVVAPSTTPAGDIVYIQFNPYGWTEPIPMWPMGSNRWAYKLYGPFNMLGSFHYRYCRNGQCDSADDLASAGGAARGREIITSLTEQDIQDVIQDWAWLTNSEPTALVGSPVSARAADFVSGVEIQPAFQPNWSYHYPQALQNIRALGANWVIFTPTWTYRRTAPLEFGLLPGHDPFWLDSALMINQARALNLNVGLFPTPRFDPSASEFWRRAPRDANWWQAWFDHYRAFVVNYADLAAQSGSQALLLGGDWLGPALPNGTLSDGTPSGVPPDAEARWKSIVAEVRQHFKGKVWWALPYTPGAFRLSLNFLQDTDGIYLLWSAPLATHSPATKEEMAEQAGTLLDNEVSALPSVLNQPLMLALAYPSAQGAANGCVDNGQGECLDWSAFDQPNDPPGTSVDLQEQKEIYEALLNAINARLWIGGVIARGYYPPAMLQDKSASVHGKPAADLLWYWFPRLTGMVK